MTAQRIGHRFSMDAERWQELKSHYGIVEQGSHIYCAVFCVDWPNAEEHQEWLDTAPVTEILDWALSLEHGCECDEH